MINSYENNEEPINILFVLFIILAHGIYKYWYWFLSLGFLVWVL